MTRPCLSPTDRTTPGASSTPEAGLSRRQAMKLAATAVAGAALHATGRAAAAQERPTRPSTGKTVIVAGAGIAGLCCGYELMKRGHEVVVLEASGRHGGHVFTIRDRLSDGLYADGGAEHITRPGYERYWQYTEELDLTVLPYARRENILRRIDGHFYTEEMLHDPAVPRRFGFNPREIRYLSENPWWAPG